MIFSVNQVFNTIPELKNKVYYFLLINDNSLNLKYGFDERIKDTVIACLKKFICSDKIVVYTCEDKDGRGLARKNLFQRWYFETNGILKRDYDFVKSGIYSSVLYNESFDQLEVFEIAIEHLFLELNDSKDY